MKENFVCLVKAILPEIGKIEEEFKNLDTVSDYLWISLSKDGYLEIHVDNDLIRAVRYSSGDDLLVLTKEVVV